MLISSSVLVPLVSLIIGFFGYFIHDARQTRLAIEGMFKERSLEDLSVAETEHLLRDLNNLDLSYLGKPYLDLVENQVPNTFVRQFFYFSDAHWYQESLCSSKE